MRLTRLSSIKDSAAKMNEKKKKDPKKEATEKKRKNEIKSKKNLSFRIKFDKIANVSVAMTSEVVGTR